MAKLKQVKMHYDARSWGQGKANSPTLRERRRAAAREARRNPPAETITEDLGPGRASAPPAWVWQLIDTITRWIMALGLRP